jgi:hypothetical protein
MRIESNIFKFSISTTCEHLQGMSEYKNPPNTTYQLFETDLMLYFNIYSSFNHLVIIVSLQKFNQF